MADAPYNPETGEWKVFQDPRQQQRAKSRTATVPMAATREGAWTTTANLTGDVRAAEDLLPNANQQLRVMHLLNVNDFEQCERFMPMDNAGGYINCRRAYHEDAVDIHIRPKLKPLSPFLLNFDASKQTNFGKTFYDGSYGLPLYYYNGEPTQTEHSGYSGVGLVTTDPQNGYSIFASSMLFHNTLKDQKQSSTVYLVATVNGVWPGSGYRAGGGGLDFYYNTTLLSFGLTASIESGWTEEGCRFQYGDLGLGDGSYVSEYINENNKRFILCSKSSVLSVDKTGETNHLTGNSYYNIKTRQILYLNGKPFFDEVIVDEDIDLSWLKNTIADSSVYNGQWSYGIGGAGVHQALITNDFHTEDQVQSTTDTLAKKWGL